ncbi:MAG: MBL fold metallo-hydrolase [Bacteroidales bacterium]|nr:MBL fold metallo-hydrolase [Bacteroidales bacterium]
MIKYFTFNHFAENTFILIDDKTKECAIIDPGAKVDLEKEELYTYIQNNNLSVKYILLTHPHIDHFCGAESVCKHYNLPLSMHKEGEKLLEVFAQRGSEMGFEDTDLSEVEKNFLEYNTTISLGEYTIKILDSSGHAPGSISYYVEKENAVFVGDAVFFCSIGRTDLYGGDLDLLLHNIRKNILSLPEDTQIFSGHGPLTDVAYEAANNPYINNLDF